MTEQATLSENTISATTPADLPQLPSLTTDELETLIKAWGLPGYRARQVIDWRNKGETDPDALRNLPADLKQRLKTDLLCQPLVLIRRQLSSDGTRKYITIVLPRPH
ncbi:MAG: hypothetical protein R8L58_07380 [Mariprofundaceae bacterium]